LVNPQFYTQDVPFEEHGMCNWFSFDESEKIGRRTYKLTGELPPCATGSYVLSGMTARTLTGFHDYHNSIDYRNQFPVIHLDNRNQKVFPKILEIGSSPPSN
jgi:hypothetical protein